MVCANDDAILRHIPTKPRYVELPSELFDHTLGSDMVYQMMNQLISERGKFHRYVLQYFH